MYKIVCCNLGYDGKLTSLEDKVSKNLNDLIGCIKYIEFEDGKIDGYAVKKINYNISEQDFENENDINIIETEDVDRCIYISKID
jgi:hypothetical protein